MQSTKHCKISKDFFGLKDQNRDWQYHIEKFITKIEDYIVGDKPTQIEAEIMKKK